MIGQGLILRDPRQDIEIRIAEFAQNSAHQRILLRGITLGRIQHCAHKIGVRVVMDFIDRSQRLWASSFSC